MNIDKAQWKELELKPPPTSAKWVVAEIYKANKLTFYNVNRNRRLGLSPSGGVETVMQWRRQPKIMWGAKILEGQNFWF